MKKPLAYILIVLGIIIPVCTEIVVAQRIDDPKISQEMYETSKGLRVIISAIEVRMAANRLELYVIFLSAFLLGAGGLILLSEKIRVLKYRIEKLEGVRDTKP